MGASVGDWEIFQRIYPSLRRFAAFVGPVESEPDDLVQEALVRVLRRCRLTDLDSPEAYLRRTVVNLASNHRRRLGSKRRALERLSSSANADTLVSYPSDLSDLLLLPPGSRAALFLSVEGFGYEEIGQLLECSEGTARRRVSRAKAQLRRKLALEVLP